MNDKNQFVPPFWVTAVLWMLWLFLWGIQMGNLYQQYQDTIGYDAQIYWEAGHGNTTHMPWIEGGGWVYGEPMRLFFVVVTAPFDKLTWTIIWMALTNLALVDTVRRVTTKTPIAGWIIAFYILPFVKEIAYCGNVALVLAWLLTTTVGLNLVGMVKLYLAPLACLVAGSICYHRHSRKGTAP